MIGIHYYSSFCLKFSLHPESNAPVSLFSSAVSNNKLINILQTDVSFLDTEQKVFFMFIAEDLVYMRRNRFSIAAYNSLKNKLCLLIYCTARLCAHAVKFRCSEVYTRKKNEKVEKKKVRKPNNKQKTICIFFQLLVHKRS